MAGERLQAKVVERHVRTQARDAAGMQLLSQPLSRCAAARPGKKKDQDETVDEKDAVVTKYSFFFLSPCDKDDQNQQSHIICCTPWLQGG